MTKPYDGPERRMNFFDQGYEVVKGPDMTLDIRLKVELIIIEAIKKGHVALNNLDDKALRAAIAENTNRIEQAFLGIGREALKDIEKAIEGRK